MNRVFSGFIESGFGVNVKNIEEAKEFINLYYIETEDMEDVKYLLEKDGTPKGIKEFGDKLTYFDHGDGLMYADTSWYIKEGYRILRYSILATVLKLDIAKQVNE